MSNLFSSQKISQYIQSPLHKYDIYLIFPILLFFILTFFLWILVNVFGTNDRFIWFVTIIISAVLSYKLTSAYHVSVDSHPAQSKKPYLLLLIFILLTVFYYIEPTFHSFSSLGIPNKDLHDGIATYISIYGIPPLEGNENSYAFIPNTNNGVNLGYPNAFHSLATLIIKFGISPLYATWITFTIGIIIHSLSIFILLLYMRYSRWHAALIAGFFGFSSFRLWYGIITSIPMAFTYTLVVPSLILWIIALYRGQNYHAYIAPAISLAVIAASYTGIIGFQLMIVSIFLLLFLKYVTYQAIQKVLFGVLISVFFIVTVLLFQYPIYWRNTFPTRIDYDPFELSQKMFPLDQPLYMIAYGLSLGYIFYTIVKQRKLNKEYIVHNYLLLLNIGLFILPLMFDLVFHIHHGSFNQEALATINPDGILGALKHQMISRIALLQPYFFILFLTSWVFVVPNKKLQLFITFLILTLPLTRIQLSLYQPLHNSISQYLYNDTDAHKPYTLLSHLRMVRNNQLWFPDLQQILNEIVMSKDSRTQFLLVDTREWSEESIAGWSSVYLKLPVIGYQRYANQILPNAFSHLLLIDPEQSFADTALLLSRWDPVQRYAHVSLFRARK